MIKSFKFLSHRWVTHVTQWMLQLQQIFVCDSDSLLSESIFFQFSPRILNRHIIRNYLHFMQRVFDWSIATRSAAAFFFGAFFAKILQFFTINLGFATRIIFFVYYQKHLSACMGGCINLLFRQKLRETSIDESYMLALKVEVSQLFIPSIFLYSFGNMRLGFPLWRRAYIVVV